MDMETSENSCAVALQLFGKNWNFILAKNNLVAIKDLIELLMAYNDQVNDKAKARFLPFVLEARKECFPLMTFSDGKTDLVTYFHGIYSGMGTTDIKYIYESNGVKWSRSISTCAIAFLHENPSGLCPIDPLRVKTDIPQIVLDKLEKSTIGQVMEILKA